MSYITTTTTTAVYETFTFCSGDTSQQNTFYTKDSGPSIYQFWLRRIFVLTTNIWPFCHLQKHDYEGLIALSRDYEHPGLTIFNYNNIEKTTKCVNFIVVVLDILHKKTKCLN